MEVLSSAKKVSIHIPQSAEGSISFTATPTGVHLIRLIFLKVELFGYEYRERHVNNQFYEDEVVWKGFMEWYWRLRVHRLLLKKSKDLQNSSERESRRDRFEPKLLRITRLASYNKTCNISGGRNRAASTNPGTNQPIALFIPGLIGVSISKIVFIGMKKIRSSGKLERALPILCF